MINLTANGRELVPFIGLFGAVSGWYVYTRYYRGRGEDENPPTPRPPTDSFPRQVYD